MSTLFTPNLTPHQPSTIANLERIASQLTPHRHTNPPPVLSAPPPQPQPQPPQPIVTQKRRRHTTAPPAPDNSYTDHELSQKKPEELRRMAEQGGKRTLSRDQAEEVMKFQEVLDVMVAIKAIKMGVTVGAIEEQLGRRLGIRVSSLWNWFLQSPEASTIFKSHTGISNGRAMRQLSDMWEAKSDEERKMYQGNRLRDVADENEDSGSELGPSKRRAVDHPRTIVRKNAVSLKKYHDNVETWVNEIACMAKPVAKSNHCEIVIVAISKHLGKHNFQFLVPTPGAETAVAMLTINNGSSAFQAELQGLLVGKTAEEVENHKDGKSAGRALHREVVSDLSKLLEKKTGTPQWPWTNTDAKLAKAGVQLVLMPGHQSSLETFKSRSKNLAAHDCRKMKHDLAAGLVSLIPIASPANNSL